MSFTLASLVSLRVLIGAVGVGYSLYSNRIGGDGANKEDWNFSKVPEAIFGETVGGIFADWFRSGAADWNKIKNIPPDELNHDLQRAARKAQLMATWFACQSCLANLKFDRSSYLKRLKNIVVNDSDIRWLITVSKRLKDEIDALPNAKFDDDINYQELFNIFDKDKIVNPEKSAKEFAEKIKEENLKEIENNYYSKFFGQIAIDSESGYKMLKDAISNGWDELKVEEDFAGFIKLNISRLQPNENGKKYDWFKLVCIIFNEEYKNDQKIQAALQKREILEIKSLLLASDSLGYLGKLENQIKDLTLEILAFKEEILNLIYEVKQNLHGLTRVNEEIATNVQQIATNTQKSYQEYYQEQKAKEDVGLVLGNFVYIHPTKFFDRDKERASLRTSVFDRTDTIIVIKGGGGFGKTSLLDYFLKENLVKNNKIFQPDKADELVIFNGQEGNIKFELLFERTADLLKRARREDRNLRTLFQTNLSDENRVALLFEEISRLGKVWFVFDNCESALDNNNCFQDNRLQYFFDYACRVNNGFRLFLTTREIPQFANNHLAFSIEIQGSLPLDDAVNYLKSFNVNWRVAKKEDEYLRVLANKLGCVPKALYSFYDFFNQKRERPLVLSKVLENEELFADFERHDFEKGYGKLVAEHFKVIGNLEQTAWKVLSVFQESVSSEAIKFVLAEFEIDGIWELLQGSGWVICEERELNGEPYYFYALEETAKNYIYKNLLSKEEKVFFNLKAARFYYYINKPVDSCYALEDFDTYFKEIEHCFQADFNERIVQIISEIMLKIISLGLVKETLERSQRVKNLLKNDLVKATNFGNIGLSLEVLGYLEEAIIEYNSAIYICENIVYKEGRSEFSNYLAMGYMNKGNALHLQGKLDEAIIEFDKAIELLDDLVHNQGRSEFLHNLAMSYMNKGNSLSNLDRLDESIVEYDKSINIRFDFVHNKGVLELANDLAMTYDNKGISLARLNKLVEAIDECDKSIELRFYLVYKFGYFEFASNLAMTYSNKGTFLNELGKVKEAKNEYNKAISILYDLVNNKGRVDLADGLATVYMNNGDALNQLNEKAKALEMFIASIICWEALVNIEQNQYVPKLAKAYRIYAISLINFNNWKVIAIIAIKSVDLFEFFIKKDFSDKFKREVGRELSSLLWEVKQLSNDYQEKIFAEANKIGEEQEEKIPFGDNLRKYVDRIE